RNHRSSTAKLQQSAPSGRRSLHAVGSRKRRRAGRSTTAQYRGGLRHATGTFGLFEFGYRPDKRGQLDAATGDPHEPPTRSVDRTVGGAPRSATAALAIDSSTRYDVGARGAGGTGREPRGRGAGTPATRLPEKRRRADAPGRDPRPVPSQAVRTPG